MELKMQPLTLKKLQETFVNKICTIITTTVSKMNFTDQQFADFFTGLVESLDDNGVFIRHHITGCKSFYTWNFIVGILEEQVLKEDDPEYKQIANKITPVVQEKSPQNQFVDPEALMNLTRKNTPMIQKNQ